MDGRVQQAVWNLLRRLQDAEENPEAERVILSGADRAQRGGLIADRESGKDGRGSVFINRQFCSGGPNSAATSSRACSFEPIRPSSCASSASSSMRLKCGPGR